MSYPESNEIVTLAEVKAINNIPATTTDYDDYLTNIIPTVGRAVESYCRRRFCKSNWFQWSPIESELLTDNWPINYVVLIGVPYDVAIIEDTSNYNNFNITQETSNNIEVESKLTISNVSSLITTEYLFSDYPTLGQLKDAVEANVASVTITYQPSIPSTVQPANISTLMLRSTSGKTLYAGLNIFDLTTSDAVGDVYRMGDNSDRLLLNPNFTNVSGMYDNAQSFYSYGYANIDSSPTLGWYQNQNTLVVYNAGYTTAKMPKELKWVVASVIQDLMSLYDIQGNGVYKGIYSKENLGDYGYSIGGIGSSGYGIGDTAGVAGLLNKYHDILDIFKKKNI